MKTATAESTPVLIYQSQGMHQGEGYGNGKWRQEKEHYEWYDNVDGTYTMKKVVMTKTADTTKGEEDIHIHRTTVETIIKEEYFKRKLAGTV